MSVSNVATGAPQFVSSKPSASRSWLRLYSKVVCAAVASLIFFGALVTSHDAGLAVPDWPTTYGENMFLYPPSKWVGPIFYEHFHRLKASFVGLLTVILTFWILKIERRRWVRVLGVLALVGVIIQGLLGGLTVLLKLPDLVSVAHGMLAQTFFCLTIVIAYSQSKEFEARLRASLTENSRLLWPAVILCAIVYLQLLFGAVMRHAGAGVAVLDFPTTGGAWLPRFDAESLASINELRHSANLASASLYQVITHSVHRFWAYIVVFATLGFACQVLRGSERPEMRSIARLLIVTVIVQFTLGVLAVISVRQPYIASVHVIIGAIMLGLCVLAVLRAYPLKR